jgi:hypothetical protein
MLQKIGGIGGMLPYDGMTRTGSKGVSHCTALMSTGRPLARGASYWKDAKKASCNFINWTGRAGLMRKWIVRFKAEIVRMRCAGDFVIAQSLNLPYSPFRFFDK